MDSSKKIIGIFFLLQVFFTQAKGSCVLDKDTVLCKGRQIKDLNLAFEAVLKMPAPVLIVEETSLLHITNHTSGKAFRTIRICNNQELKSIDPSAFELSISKAQELKIEDCPLLKDSIWGLVSKMTAVSDLVLFNVGLTMIPADAFKGRQFGSLSLQRNNLTNDSFDNIFKDVGSITELNLLDNLNMTQLKESAFKDLLDAGTRVLVGTLTKGNVNSVQRVGAEWLCAKNEKGAYLYAEKVSWFIFAEKKFEGIFDYCYSWSKSQHVSANDGVSLLHTK